jgi:hypothetical protein
MERKDFLETLGDSQLEDIIKRNGVIITPELATDELRARRRNRENPFEKFENKYYIYKNEDTIVVLRTSVYSEEEDGLSLTELKFGVYHGMLDSDARISMSQEYVGKDKISYYFKNFKEITPSEWLRYQDIYNRLMVIMTDNIFGKE